MEIFFEAMGAARMLNIKNLTRLFKLFMFALLVFQTFSFGNAQESNKSASPADLQFVSGLSVSRMPFERAGNFIHLRARVNDSEPLWFLLDTGATASYFDVERAKALGLGQNDFVKGVSLDFPGVKLVNQKFLPQRLGFGVYNGHAVDGLLGYDFISRFVIEIDYVNNTVSLHEPNSYNYSSSGEVVPLDLLADDSGGKVPLVRVKITQQGRSTVEGKFIADTAVRSALSFNTPFVDANNLLQSARQTIQVPLGGGAMVRESKQSIGRVPNVQLGRFRFKKNVAIFFQDKQGVVASPEFDGVIGAEILRRFKVIFDYSRQRMILESNRYISDPEEYDMSGILLIAEGKDFKTFKVGRIIEHSPAEAAGLREGDVITAIDRKPISTLVLEQVRQMFKQNGRSYRLMINRDGQMVQTKIKLRRLI
ncbi:MAG TPA: aspartyl protease family protein [Pyrinomonadaceae bacterium]|nr:aspartyl protease family protein [Pyrinomonadaceae bacterium]